MPSAVAGIVDRGGGLRIVAGPLGNMFCHVSRGERLYVHPTLVVETPVPAGDVADLIATVEEYVRERRMP